MSSESWIIVSPNASPVHSAVSDPPSPVPSVDLLDPRVYPDCYIELERCDGQLRSERGSAGTDALDFRDGEESDNSATFLQAEYEAEVERQCKAELLAESDCDSSDDSIGELLCEEEMYESSAGEGSNGGEVSLGDLSDAVSGAEESGGDRLDAEHAGNDGRRDGFQGRAGKGKAEEEGENIGMAIDGDQSGVPEWMRFGASPPDTGSDDDGAHDNGYGCAELGNPGVRYVEEMYKSIGRSGKEAVDLWRSGFGGHNGRRYVIHDVFRLGAAHRDPEVISKQLARLSTGTFIVSVHGCHLHCVHACRFSNSTCRCYITKHLRGKFGRWVARRNRQEREYSEEWWSYLAIYLCSGGRRAAKVSVEGRNWSYHSKTGTLPVRKNRSAEAVQLVGRRGMADAVPPRSPRPGPSCAEGDLRAENESPCGERSRGDNDTSRIQRRNKGEQILDRIMGCVVTPLGRFFDTRLWLEGPFRWMPLDQKCLRVAVRLAQFHYTQMTYTEILNKILNVPEKNRLFSSNTPQETYYSEVESFEIALILLSHQMQFSNIKAFLEDLLDIIDKKKPKVNSFFVWAPANSGKNFFFDSVLQSCVNFGQMGNFTKYDNFPLQECVQRRIILWNEPSCESSSLETLKCILGGDTCNVKVKYSNDYILHRTPVIVLSNNDIFPNEQAFRTRMIRYTWRTAPFLRDYSKKLHPLTLMYLLLTYNLLDRRYVRYDDTKFSQCLRIHDKMEVEDAIVGLTVDINAEGEDIWMDGEEV